MESIILNTNAVPVYGFLSFIHARQVGNDPSQNRKILDCGAGGPYPPLALFAQHGFEAWGIDNSEEQMDFARQFCEQNEVQVQLRPGDMRHIPFEDETFDYVYEHYSMCHLSKHDTAQAIGEMRRVLKPGGFCFLGVISAECWPAWLMGEEKELGEYWGEEGGETRLHSLFSDEEAETMLSKWEILFKQKHVSYLWGGSEKLSLEMWMNAYEDSGRGYSREGWLDRYESKANEFQYIHLYFYLRKV